jgi:hypothetical protein
VKLTVRWPAMALAVCPFVCLVIACGPEQPSRLGAEAGEGAERVASAAGGGKTVSNAIWTACSTSIVRPLAQQLIDEVRCLRPGAVSSIADIAGVTFGGGAFPYLQTGAAKALRRAVARKGAPLYLSSVLRTLPQQYLLRKWYENGRCGIPLAARPGSSNHESGLAIDVPYYSAWRWTLAAEGFRWFGSSDVYHFDYTGPRVDLRYYSVLAFQRLWNRNNPYDRIGEDGGYGPATSARLARAPVAGFAKGATCVQQPPPPPPTPTLAIEVYWKRLANGSYDLRALAPQQVVSVEYIVDGFVLAPGKIARAAGHNFPSSYRFSLDRQRRLFEVRGYDKAGKRVGLGVGLLDVTAGTAVYIRQMGAGLYEVGLERAPAGVAYLEVRAESWLLTDSVSKQTRVDGSRLAVRSSFSRLGEREFILDTYNADGSHRGTLRRTFTLK